MEARASLLRLVIRTLGEVLNGIFQIIEQHVGHVAGKAFLADAAQDRQVFPVFGEGICGHQPAALADFTGYVKHAEVRFLIGSEGEYGNVAAVGDQVERPQLGNA